MILTGLLLAACNSAPPVATPVPEGPGGEGPANGRPASGEITFQVFGDPAEHAVFQEVVKGFEASQTGVRVRINHVPSQNEYMTKLSAALLGGTPPDVFLINYRRYGQFVSKGVIEPAGPLMRRSGVLNEDMYYPEALSAFNYRGELQCVPQNVSNLVVYYNKDLFRKAGVEIPPDDWSWDQFLDAAVRLTYDENGDGRTDVYGVGVEPVIIRLAPFVWQSGGEIVDDPEKPTTLTLMEGPAREAVQFFVGLRLSHRVVPTEAEAKAEDDETRFMNGRLAMVLASRASTPIFREITGFEWDVAPLPRRTYQASILHSDAYCIAAASKNKEAAWAFVEYAQGTEGQTIAARLGRTVPSLKSVANSPAFLDPSRPPANSKVFLDAVPTMKQVPVLSTWPRIENTVNEELERAFYGYVPIDEALRKATDDTRPLFAEGSADK